MAVVFFGRRPVANTNANGEHQTRSWTPSQGMSIPLSNAGTHKINQRQFVAESRIFSIVRHQAIEISSENNYQKITMYDSKN
jgi:hypothetical protein